MSQRPNHDPDKDDPNFYDKWVMQYLGYIHSDDNFYPPDEPLKAIKCISENATSTLPSSVPTTDPEPVSSELEPQPSTSSAALVPFAPPLSAIQAKQQSIVYAPFSLAQLAAFSESNGEETSTFKTLKKGITKHFKLLRSNGHPVPCNCQPSQDGLTCHDKCSLRQKRIECLASCGPQCQNQRIQRKEFLECLHIGSRQGYYYCLYTSAAIPKGTLLIEYTGIITPGRILLNQPYCYPIRTYNSKQTFYMNCDLYGNESRYIPHCFDPNCKMEQWFVNGHVRLVVVAKLDILKDSVITIGYPQRLDHKRFKVHDPCFDLRDVQYDRRAAAGVIMEMSCAINVRRRCVQYTNAEGKIICNYGGECKKVADDEEEMETHKDIAHHAIPPECYIPTSLKPSKSRKAKRSSSLEDHSKLLYVYEDCTQRETLEYYPGLRKIKGSDDVKTRKELLAAKQAYFEKKAAKNFDKYYQNIVKNQKRTEQNAQSKVPTNPETALAIFQQLQIPNSTCKTSTGEEYIEQGQDYEEDPDFSTDDEMKEGEDSEKDPKSSTYEDMEEGDEDMEDSADSEDAELTQPD